MWPQACRFSTSATATLCASASVLHWNAVAVCGWRFHTIDKKVKIHIHTEHGDNYIALETLNI